MQKTFGSVGYMLGAAVVLGVLALVSGTFSRVSASPGPDYQTVRKATGAGLSKNLKSVHATCPAGKNVLGGGAVVGYQSGTSFVTDPNGRLVETEPDGANGWQASGIDTTPGDSWAVVAYVLCAKL